MKLNKVEKEEKSIVSLEIAVDKAAFDAACEKAYHKNVSKINVPGFRKGKAPRKIIEKMYGEGFFYEEAINICYPEAYEAALKESGTEPVGPCDINISSIDENGFVFVAKVPVKPEVTLGAYKGLSAEYVEPVVTDEDVQGEIERVAERNAAISTVEREIKAGAVSYTHLTLPTT